VWTELSAGGVKVDPFRRALQREYLEVVGEKVNPRPGANTANNALIAFLGGTPGPQTGISDDAKVMLRGELETLDGQLRAALPRATDRATRLHITGMRAQIDRVLHPSE
jgi:hypothetical protein